MVTIQYVDEIFTPDQRALIIISYC